MLVRPAILNDRTAHQITRADTAALLVHQLSSDAHLNRAVTIANA